MKLLVATDGSDSARAAVDFVAAFPFPNAGDVTIVTVMKLVIGDRDIQGLSDEQVREFEKLQRSERAEAQQLLDSEAERLRVAGLAVSTALRRGNPSEEIIRAAEEVGADLVVVGSHGQSGLKRFLLGSVSDHVMTTAQCSVLIVKDPAAFGGKDRAFPWKDDRPWRLLLAYDDSEPAKKAVEFCATLFQPETLSLKAITVLPLIRMYRQDIRQQLNWMWQIKKKTAREGLEWVARQLNEVAPGVETELEEEADVAQALLDAGERMEADLIVLGSKGKSAVKRVLLGSVIRRVAHHAACSVLAVRR